MILKPDGSLWSTAIGVRSSQLSKVDTSFVRVMSSEVTACAAGADFSIILKTDSNVWSVGRNYQGQLGDGTLARKQGFVPAQMIAFGKAVAAGSGHSILVTEEGHVWTVGWNKYGQLGEGVRGYRTRFHRVFYHGAMAASAGDAHSLLLTKGGSVWSSGWNSFGQLGDGSNIDRSSFVKVISDGVIVVAAGGYHSLIVKEDGSVWATGCNTNGQLGDLTTTNRLIFVQVYYTGGASGKAKSAAAGSRHSVVLNEDGSVWTSGHNMYGQLGDGSTSDMQVFGQAIAAGATVIGAGCFHTMVIAEDGSIWAAGSNRYGQYGDGKTYSSLHFIMVARLGKDTLHKNSALFYS